MRSILYICFLSFLLLTPVPSTAQTRTRKRASTTQKSSSRHTTRTTSSSAKTKRNTPATRKRATRATKAKTPSVSSLRSRRDQLQRELRANEARLRSTDMDVKRQLSDLAVINGKIDKQRRAIDDIQYQIDSLNHHINRLSNDYSVLSKQLQDRRSKYRRSLLYLYRNKGQQSKLLFILSANSFSQMLRRYRYVREYAKYQQAQGRLIQKKQQQVAQVKGLLVKTQSDKSSALRQQRNENTLLTQQQGKQQESVKQLQNKQRQIRNVIAANKKEMAQLNARIDYYVRLAIEQERKRREAEIRARAEAARKKALAEEAARRKAQAAAESRTNSSSKSSTAARKTPSETDRASSESPKTAPMESYRTSSTEYALSQNFASNKGRLPMPITGSYIITAHYGSYNMEGLHNVQLSNKGINVTGHPGAAARCIFPGVVSYVFSLGGMYNVLVRHGSYISVYCNLSSISVSKGQHISARATIGRIANDASGRPTLHFQLRKETSTLNPESWLAR